jgi:protoporphyrinogen oxidase
MSPQGRTSLVAELPCQDEDPAWADGDEAVIDRVRGHLETVGWVGDGEVIDACSRRLGNAYPVLDTGSDQRVAAIAEYLEGLGNLHLSGRSGRFVYGWIHTMMRFGREIVQEIAGGV